MYKAPYAFFIYPLLDINNVNNINNVKKFGMTIQFLKSIMRIPSCSGHEDLMQGFVMQWAKSNGVQCSEDGKGNLYLTKGSSEWYPCVAAHMDTVFDE